MRSSSTVLITSWMVKTVWHQLGHLETSEVGAVLARAQRRIERARERRGALTGDATDASDANRETEDAFEARLAASAVSGPTPPATT
jgi:hypothetical protein